MDQKKIGSFLKELRKERNLTQEVFAEIMRVSNRTVSRWETGTNLPDLDLLVEIADYYDLDIRELMDGERKSEKMNDEMKDTLLKVADFTLDEREKVTKRMNLFFILGVVAFFTYFILKTLGLADTGISQGIANFALGLSGGVLMTGVIYTSAYMVGIRNFKKRLIRHR